VCKFDDVSLCTHRVHECCKTYGQVGITGNKQGVWGMTKTGARSWLDGGSRGGTHLCMDRESP
jgi:hypothetical protein